MSTTNTVGLSPSFATIPLISSSLAVFYAFLEATIFDAFLRAGKVDPKGTNRALRLWWTNWLPYGLGAIFGVVLPTSITSIYALTRLSKNDPRYIVYAAGALFSLGHFAFGATISQRIYGMCDEENEKKGQTMELQRQWMRIHAWRTATMDVPALLCFVRLVYSL